MPEIEFYERIDKSIAVGVHIGGRVVVMSLNEWLETARDIVAQVEAHLTKRATDLRSARRVPCTCGMDDGLHEWDCAISRANR
ncbi:MAG TPA: hypothetical protein PKC99_17055 [Anaerolineales bacterium]|nr:hypothetical protein [Anaerolineales bacterium]